MGTWSDVEALCQYVSFRLLGGGSCGNTDQVAQLHLYRYNDWGKGDIGTKLYLSGQTSDLASLLVYNAAFGFKRILSWRGISNFLTSCQSKITSWDLVLKAFLSYPKPTVVLFSSGFWLHWQRPFFHPLWLQENYKDQLIPTKTKEIESHKWQFVIQ